MRLGAVLLAACLPAAAFAQDSTTMAEDGALLPSSGIMFSTSISVNVPLLAADRAGKQAEEDTYRKDLYKRSINECAVLLDTIAARCDITSVNVSTQINSNPGQADYLYATANLTMQVELK